MLLSITVKPGVLAVIVKLASGVVPPTAPPKVTVPVEERVGENAPSSVLLNVMSPAPELIVGLFVMMTGLLKITEPPLVVTLLPLYPR